MFTPLTHQQDPVATLKTSKILAAPVSTIVFIPKSSQPSDPSNIPQDKHWTDCPSPGSIALLQQPSGQVCAVLGDILATRLKVRGVQGVVADGRVRDLTSIGELCAEDQFQVWSRSTSTVGTGLEAKAWSADVPITVNGLTVQPGDVLFADPAERGIVVIPVDKLQSVVELLPGLKEADDRVVADVTAGVDVTEAFKRHRKSDR